MNSLERFFAIVVIMTLASCTVDPDPTEMPRFGFALDGEPITAAQLADVSTSTGIHPSLVVFFMAWPESVEVYRSPLESLEMIQQANAIPVITWEPFIDRGDRVETILASEILSGKFDDVIDAFAADLVNFDHEVWIRFAHEMNFNHYHWGVTAEDFNATAPLIYRDMFRYVVTRVRAAGATNVKWVFCPNAESIPNPERDADATWNRASRYYPGDEFVDVLGMDGYNWGTSQTLENATWTSRWQSFEEIFAPLHAELVALAPDKPIYVFETASTTSGGNKEGWMQDTLETAQRWGLEGVCWFEVDKETNWLIQHGVSQTFLAAFAASVNAAPPDDQ